MDTKYNQYLLITTLPAWVLECVDALLITLARLTGHAVILSTVRDAAEKASAND